MSVDKMIEKTKKVLQKQQELNDLVIEMKNEVREVEKENYRLKNENEYLKEKVLENRAKQEPVIETPIVTPKKEVNTAINEEVKVKEKVIVSLAGGSNREKTGKRRVRTETENNIIEFFLGKNVIVKIAAILMVLAVLTFGQIAYVDFLNDFGRFLLIIVTGVLFVGLGNFFERKKVEVYSSIFYILGLAVLLVSNILGLEEYTLYPEGVFMIYLLGITLIPVVYFYNKRYKFLDVANLIYYSVIMVLPILVFNNYDTPFVEFMLITLVVLTAGFGIFRHFTVYLDKGKSLVLFDFVVLFVLGFIVLMSADGMIATDSIRFPHISVLIYQIIVVFLYYVINLRSLKEQNNISKYFILLSTTVILVMLGITLSRTISKLIGYEVNSYSMLISTLLLLPIYVNLSRKGEDKRITGTYISIVSVITVIFTFTFNGGRKIINASAFGDVKSIDPFVRQIVLMSELILMYFFSLLNKDKVKIYLSYFFMGVVTVYLLVKYTFDSSFVFSNAGLFIPVIIGALAIYVMNWYFDKEDEQRTKMIVTSFAIAALVPFVLTFTRELILHDSAVMISMLVIYMIGMRCLIKLSFFGFNRQNDFVFGYNIVLVLLILLINTFYFDHDFTVFSDVMKFFFGFVVNVYLIQALREVYGYVKEKISGYEERWFIFIYITGVLIQAIFITTFINFDFDKVILSSYYMIASAVAILLGFRSNWINVRKIGLFAIYFSLAKFFIYDFWKNDFDMYTRFISYFTLAMVLFGISALYSYLERTYGDKKEIE